MTKRSNRNGNGVITFESYLKADLWGSTTEDTVIVVSTSPIEFRSVINGISVNYWCSLLLPTPQNKKETCLHQIFPRKVAAGAKTGGYSAINLTSFQCRNVANHRAMKRWNVSLSFPSLLTWDNQVSLVKTSIERSPKHSLQRMNLRGRKTITVQKASSPM